MKTTRAIAAAATVSTVAANGSIAIVNRCSYDLYVWSVAGAEAPGGMVTLPANTPTTGYKETFRLPPNRGGISLKVAPNYVAGYGVPEVITQLEYTVPDGSYAPVADKIFYDVSWVNANPLSNTALTMQSSLGGTADACPSGTCYPGQACSIGYLWDKDDAKTNACSLEADLIFTFCSVPGSSLTVPSGLIAWGQTKREAEPEPEPLALADAEADPLAVCIGLNGGIAQLCPDTPTSSSTSTSTTPAAPTSTKAKSTPAPVVALQKPAEPKTTSVAAPAPASTSAAAPVESAVAGAVNSLLGTTASLLQLTSIADCGVTKWLTYSDGVYARSVEEPEREPVVSKREAHAHNHAHNHLNFHRRNRIQRAKA